MSDENDYAINVNFEGHAPETIVLQQHALGISPALVVIVDMDDDNQEVNFDIDAYGAEDLRGFLETVQAVLSTILERNLERPEAGEDAEDGDSGDGDDEL